MKKLLILGVLIFIVLVNNVYADELSEEAKKAADAADVLTAITSIPEKQIPPTLLRNCYGIAIIPNVIKASFVIGGRFGKGVLAVRDEAGSWKNPFFVSLVGGSFGWQMGAQATDLIMVFKSTRSIERIKSGKFTLTRHFDDDSIPKDIFKKEDFSSFYKEESTNADQ